MGSEKRCPFSLQPVKEWNCWREGYSFLTEVSNLRPYFSIFE